MAEAGDRVRVQSQKLGQAVREGVVTGVAGHMLRVRWSTGEESTFMPGPGAVTVVGKVRATKKAPGKKTAGAATKPAATKPATKKVAKKT
jgi:hypothetical protein